MKIEKLSDCSVKIILSERDLSYYGIQYNNWDSENAAGFILAISEDINKALGTDITREKLYVEIFSRISGCLIFISFTPKNALSRRRKCRISFTFTDFDSLRKFCAMIHSQAPEIIRSSSLYYDQYTLMLIIETAGVYKNYLIDSVSGSGIASECSEITDAVILEYYVCVISSNAISEILF